MNTEIKLLVSRRLAAETLDISPRTLDSLVDSDQLSSVRIGRRRLFRKADLENFVKSDHQTRSRVDTAIHEKRAGKVVEAQ
jgi:excisionase family DNA binding protein